MTLPGVEQEGTWVWEQSGEQAKIPFVAGLEQPERPSGAGLVQPEMPFGAHVTPFQDIMVHP